MFDPTWIVYNNNDRLLVAEIESVSDLREKTKTYLYTTYFLLGTGCSYFIYRNFT